MSVLAKQIVVWLILLTVPLQGLAAVTAVLQGRAHYHPDARTMSNPQPAKHAHATHHHGHSHHGEGQVRRHYHLPGERAVAVQNDQQHDIAAVERTSKGESVSAAFVGLLSESPVFHAPDLASGVDVGHAKSFLSIILPAIERPPRLVRV